ncbi:hypothetical protein [uncultured Clostridium sp.]|uniref:hypothetical protein n=1 Tax=uncultured Clostridium sp. TaxID=59620 RepID=UPI002624B23D|nr:hypothetical protein [uncultured Clostridium sp.]
MKKKKIKKRKYNKKVYLNNLKEEIINLEDEILNLEEITIGDYLEEQASNLMLQVKDHEEPTLDIKDLIQNNITIEEIPTLIDCSSDIQESEPIEQAPAMYEEEVAATTEIILDADIKKKELDLYLKEETKYMEFDKKLINLARPSTEPKTSSFKRYLGRFFTDDVKIFK